MNPKQITCARCRKPVESTSWWDDHTTRERVLQVRCHGAVDEMRFRPDRLSLEQLRAFSEARGVAFTSTSTAATSKASRSPLEAMVKAVSQFGEMPPETVSAWMREQGCPPEEWVVVLPERARAGFPYGTPDYVRFNNAVPFPTCVRRALGPNVGGEATATARGNL